MKLLREYLDSKLDVVDINPLDYSRYILTYSETNFCNYYWIIGDRSKVEYSFQDFIKEAPNDYAIFRNPGSEDDRNLYEAFYQYVKCKSDYIGLCWNISSVLGTYWTFDRFSRSEMENMNKCKSLYKPKNIIYAKGIDWNMFDEFIDNKLKGNSKYLKYIIDRNDIIK